MMGVVTDEPILELREGRIVADGPKRTTLTGERLSGLFGLPVTVDETGGYHYAKPHGTLNLAGGGR